MKKLLFGFGLVAFAVACSPKTTEPITSTEPTPMPEAESSEMAMVNAGETIYQSKCSKCHDAKVVKEYTEEQWASILPSMISKAKLGDEDAANVTAYVNWHLKN